MDEKKTIENQFKEMAEAGLIFGYKKTKTHPKMKPFIAANRNNVELIDLEATLSALEKTAAFLKEKIKEKSLVLLVGTNLAAQEAIKNFAEKYHFPYVIEKWLGGTLTNFNVIRNRIDYYLEIKDKMTKGEFDKYSKKEKIKINKDFFRLEKNFSNLKNLAKQPDILFVINPAKHQTAIREAKRLNVPIIAVIGTNFDPSPIAYPIPANDHSKRSIEWIMNYLEDKITSQAE